MNFLLDTHIAIWFITDNKKLPKTLKKLIEYDDNKCFVSISSYWELTIKYSLGRLDLKSPLEEIFNTMEDSRFDTLPITLPHILQLSKLEPHHHDPFDRIIITQAIIENLILLSLDNYFSAYKVPLIQK